MKVPAGRYARSLRLILRRARRAKIIPAASVIPSPERRNQSLPEAFEQPIPTFDPSQLVNPAFQTTPSAHITGLSPTNLLANATNMLNDSPASGSTADMFEFDNLFAHETLERAGLELGEGGQLPLYVLTVPKSDVHADISFLDGQSLGASHAPSEMTNFVGIENFFLPIDLDSRLTEPTMGEQAMENPLGDEVWW